MPRHRRRAPSYRGDGKSDRMAHGIMKVGARLASTVFAALLMLALALPAEAAKRVALVIGNGAYTATTRLANPPNDAADMAAALRRLGFEVVEVLDGDWRHMMAAIREFGDRSAGAEAALFYYAGHGLQVGDTTTCCRSRRSW